MTDSVYRDAHTYLTRMQAILHVKGDDTEGQATRKAFLVLFRSLLDEGFAGEDAGRADRMRKWFTDRQERYRSSQEVILAWRVLNPFIWGNVDPDLRVAIARVCQAYVGTKNFGGGAVDQFLLKYNRNDYTRLDTALETAIKEFRS